MDAARISASLEMALPVGGRPRQLPVRTLLVGMLGAAADDRPAHLVRVHRALVALDPADQRRLGVVVDWKTGPHTLTYRQVERTFGLVDRLLSADAPHPSGPVGHQPARPRRYRRADRGPRHTAEAARYKLGRI